MINVQHMDRREGIPEDRPDSLIEEFDAREQWVTWSSGLAHGLLPM